MSNFAFLQDEFPNVAEPAQRMEALAMPDARAACFYGRRTIELLVKWLYEHDASLEKPYATNLAALLEAPCFAQVVAPEIRAKLAYIKTIGNHAVHSGKRIRQYDALQVVKEVYHCGFWLVSHYTRFSPEVLKDIAFDDSLVTQMQGSDPAIPRKQLIALEKELAKKDKELEEERQKSQDYEEELAKLRAELAEAKKRNQAVVIEHDYEEDETRKRLIDPLLVEAGWDLDFNDGNCWVREFPVEMETEVDGKIETGKGFVDYALWNVDGKPLAVIEAKRTRRDPREGKRQAFLYANAIEETYGQRPVIFYTNGYQHWIWDDKRHAPRQIQGFLKRDELELMIQRRETAQVLANATVDKEIAGRYYQEQAIRQITEALTSGQRRALVVMATGSGKTRTVIALCDLLQRCQWVKRTLFLADRLPLVRQAVNAFKKHLPQSHPVNLVTEKEAPKSRVYVSTYPTMLNQIDELREGLRRFGPGHFDLVVIDEAHRSVYQKYRYVFDYFDANLIGLTATPRDEIDRDTYGIFKLAKGVPTYAYELEKAIEDTYLVPPKLITVPLQIPDRGLRHDQLSDDERAHWDSVDWGEGGIPSVVEPAAINKWLFNEDTVDKVLMHLMENGLHVDGGEKLGKTIIFAKNRAHACFIEERFNHHYPHYKGVFAQVIDHETKGAQDLVEKFSSEKEIPGVPQIAISVDMLDTGVDAPDVVNLVFFKPVRSKTKFWQMIGRGTRLREHLFGEGRHKECFYVFDFCRNFEFFNENPDGARSSVQESISTRVFRTRVDLLARIRQTLAQEEEGRAAEQEGRLTEVAKGLTDALHGEVASMHLDNFIVRTKREVVEDFQTKQRWETLTPQDYAALQTQVAGLPNQLPTEHPSAKLFDLLMLRLQLRVLEKASSKAKMILRVQEIASALEDLENIPEIRRELVLIQELQTDAYWQNVTLPMLERVRACLRGLVRHIKPGKRETVITNFEDVIGEQEEVTMPNVNLAIDRAQYKRKFLDYLKEKEDRLALQKVRRGEPLTQADLEELESILFESGDLGTREKFEACYGEQESLPRFIRELVGLDRDAAKQAFDRYLDTTSFGSRQIEFINQVIDHLTENGVMEPSLLFEHPFTNVHPEGPAGLFSDDEAKNIVEILTTINANAEAG